MKLGRDAKAFAAAYEGSVLQLADGHENPASVRAEIAAIFQSGQNHERALLKQIARAATRGSAKGETNA